MRALLAHTLDARTTAINRTNRIGRIDRTDRTEASVLRPFLVVMIGVNAIVRAADVTATTGVIKNHSSGQRLIGHHGVTLFSALLK